MTIPDDHIAVTHGKLTVYAPKNMFTGANAELVPEKTAEFRRLTMLRYPWISENSMDVLLETARNVMIDTIDAESGGRSIALQLYNDGDVAGAIKHLRKYISKDPNNAQSWYMLGMMLCRAGENEKGLKAMQKSKSLE